MRVVQTDSHGPAQFIALAVSLVNWVQAESPGDKRELERVCNRLWPGCEIYHGHTHMRVTPLLDQKHRSFYVDLSGVRRQP